MNATTVGPEINSTMIPPSLSVSIGFSSAYRAKGPIARTPDNSPAASLGPTVRNDENHSDTVPAAARMNQAMTARALAVCSTKTEKAPAKGNSARYNSADAGRAPAMTINDPRIQVTIDRANTQAPEKYATREYRAYVCCLTAPDSTSSQTRRMLPPRILRISSSV